jgi:RNA polymerase-binding transcription factor DksA
MSPEDIAQAVELRQWEANNSSRPAVIRYTPADEGYGPEFCATDECEAPLPAARREWGFTICIACKERAELKDKHFRRQ